jgi:3-oxoacyl-[acyl-carrier protein] reductase
MWNMDGKVAIITGAGNGIGRATAVLFAREKAKVVVVDVEQAAAAETVRMIRAEGGTACMELCSVADSAAVQSMVRRTEEQFGRIDVLHANAAVQFSCPATEIEESEWDRLHAVNLKGAFLCAKYAIPAMQKRKSGAIVLTSSGHAFATYPNYAAYAASKAGQVALMHAMALDYARDGIRVNCVIPGATDTRLIRLHFDSSPDPDAERTHMLDAIPLGRLARPEDIANAVLFLCSDYASYVTGTCLAVDGGLMARG